LAIVAIVPEFERIEEEEADIVKMQVEEDNGEK